MTSPYNLQIYDLCARCPVRASHPLCDMSPATIEAMDSIKSTSVYPKSATLFVEGETPRGVFILCSGKVKLTTSSREGKTLIVAIVNPGEILGAGPALLGHAYDVTAETLQPSQLNFIRRDDFVRFVNTYPEASLHVARQLSAMNETAHREIRALGLAHTATEKLGRLLLDWCARDGQNAAGGCRITILLTHEEIGQLLGTTRETVTRVLGDFRRKKLIEVKGSTLIVTDRNQLQGMVNV